jgi:hypothetical protein
MYAIQTGSKFLKPSTQYRSFYDITVSETPKFVKSHQEAVAHKNAMVAQILTSIKAFEKNVDSEAAKVAKEVAKIPKLEARLAELKELPYKDVVKKVPQVEKQLKDAMWYKTANSVNSWKRDIARLERILKGDVRVVKMTQELVDA